MELQVGVKAILKNKEGKYLFVKRSNKKYPEVGAVWDIPGGRIDKGSSLMENLRREIKEEVGLELKEIPKFIFAQDIIRPEKHVVRITYSGVIDGEPKISDEDNTEFRWFSLEEIKSLKNIDIFLKEVFEKRILPNYAITSVKAIVINANKFLVLKKNIHVREDRWDIPGGKVHYGEDPEEALRREVLEESGLHIQIEKSLGAWHYLRLLENDQVVCHTFLCKGSGKVDITNNEDEGFPIKEYKWVTKEEFLNMPANERLKKFIEKVL
ncbi:MAG: NUDIX hydrolase [Candidatus Aenigmarchaeota archaeon]|nr:NUDIX hydrolase [Candidatus Aenigmarchaeota archaeon]